MALRDMSEKKLILITIGVALLFAIPAWGAFYFVWDKYQVANQAWEDATKLHDDLEKKLDEETKKASHVEEKREEFKKVSQMLPEKDEVSNFFKDDLPNLLAKNSFEIQSLRIKEKPEKEKMSKEVNLQVFYREIEIRITGTYRNMIKLLKEIEEGREPTGTELTENEAEGNTYRLYRVKDFDFSPNTDRTLELDLKHSARITLHAFFIDESAK